MTLSKWKLWLILLVVILTLGGLIVKQMRSARLQQADAGVQSVRTAQAEMVTWQSNLNVSGTIDAVEKSWFRLTVVKLRLCMLTMVIVSGQARPWQIDDQPYANLVEAGKAAFKTGPNQIGKHSVPHMIG